MKRIFKFNYITAWLLPLLFVLIYMKTFTFSVSSLESSTFKLNMAKYVLRFISLYHDYFRPVIILAVIRLFLMIIEDMYASKTLDHNKINLTKTESNLS